MDPDDGELDLVERELIAVVVSAENRCPTCLVNHTRILGALLEDPLRAQRIASNFRTVELPTRQRALARFAYRLTSEAAAFDDRAVDDLRGAGFTDPDIAHAVELVALFNYTNRVSTGLGLHPTAAVGT